MKYIHYIFECLVFMFYFFNYSMQYIKPSSKKQKLETTDFVKPLNKKETNIEKFIDKVKSINFMEDENEEIINLLKNDRKVVDGQVDFKKVVPRIEFLNNLINKKRKVDQVL